MCLEIDRNKHEYDSETDSYKPKIAESDFYVWKIGTIKEDKFHPLFKTDFEYLKGKETEYVELRPYKGSLILTDDVEYDVLLGYHSYNNHEYAIMNFNWACLLIRTLKEFQSCSIERFLIKKGTEYFIGVNNDIVSSKIIWDPENEK